MQPGSKRSWSESYHGEASSKALTRVLDGCKWYLLQYQLSLDAQELAMTAIIDPANMKLRRFNVMWMDMNRLDTTFTTSTAHAPLAWGVSWATATKFAFVTGGNEMTIDGSVMWTASSSKFWTYTYDGQAGAYYYSGP